MWHRKQRNRLGLNIEHREALLCSLVIALVEHGRIRTTYARAREASRFADSLITISKKKSLHARRQVVSLLKFNKDAAKRLFDEITPLFNEVKGGYTRVLRFDSRPGDRAEMAILEFTKLLVTPEQEAAIEEARQAKRKKKADKLAAAVEKPVEEKPKKDKKEKTAEKKKSEEVKTEKPAKTAKAAKEEEKAADTAEKPALEAGSEEQKKGGFLGGLRKFLTGD